MFNYRKDNLDRIMGAAQEKYGEVVEARIQNAPSGWLLTIKQNKPDHKDAPYMKVLAFFLNNKAVGFEGHQYDLTAKQAGVQDAA